VPHHNYSWVLLVVFLNNSVLMFTALSGAGPLQTPRSPLEAPVAPRPAPSRVSWLTFAWLAIAASLMTLALRPIDFVHHDTTEALMWSQSPWSMGFWKHPPLLPWLLKLWFMVLPIHPISIAVFTGLNMAVGAFTVWRIARIALDPRSAFLALALLGLLPYTYMGIKLNHNSILISLWPLTILAFLLALERPTWLRGVLFGAACAASMLAKYYSGLLLVGCLLASVISPARRRFYSGAAPYTAVATFTVLMAPHALWMLDHKAQPLGYAFHFDRDGRAFALNFAVMTALLSLPPLVVGLWMGWIHKRQARLDAVVPRRRLEPELLTLIAVPYLLTIAMTLMFNLRGATAWAMPVFLYLPILIAARLPPPSHAVVNNIRRLFFIVLLAICLIAPLAARHAVSAGREGVSDPRRHIAEAVTRVWRRNIGTPLPIIAGDGRLISATTLFSSDHPQGWTGFSSGMAPWITAEAAKTNGFTAVCLFSDDNCREAVRQAAAGRGFTCHLSHRVDYLGAVGPWVESHITIVPPSDHTAPVGTAPCFGENLAAPLPKPAP
jgi:Dolichyl-phosphate-mannose-protein mannosyltransferase